MSTHGHDQHGRFTNGNRGGPGRPSREVERQYLTTLRKTVPLDAWQRIVQRVVADAEAGDSKAREWLSKYLLADPKLAERFERDFDRTERVAELQVKLLPPE